MEHITRPICGSTYPNRNAKKLLMNWKNANIMKRPNMTRQDIARRISSRTGITLKQAYQAVDETFKTIEDGLADGRQIQIRNFGTFKNVRRAARPVQNLHTGETMLLPSRTEPIVKFSENLKRSI